MSLSAVSEDTLGQKVQAGPDTDLDWSVRLRDDGRPDVEKAFLAATAPK